MTPRHKKIIEWIGGSQSGMILESQIAASGLGRALNTLLMDGFVDIVPHPTVTERTSPPIPAAAVVLTQAGRAAFAAATEAPNANMEP